MEAKELRIGNWVNTDLYGDYEIIALAIFPNGDNTAFKSLEYYPQGAKIKTLNPIELTEECLLRFGFNKIGVNYSLFINDDEFIIWTKHIDFAPIGLFFRTDKHEIEIKYIHQLQNLYFALTGEELLIK